MSDVVNVGAAANNGLGDPLRDAMIKINARFAALGAQMSDRGAWATATVYSATNRDYVREGGLYYLCRTSHTAGVFAADVTSGYWVQADVTTLWALLNSADGSWEIGHTRGAVVTTVKQELDAILAQVNAQIPTLTAVVATYVADAQAARDAAFVNADVYASTAAAQGDAGLAVGAQYQVIVGSDLVRYRKDSGVASTEMVRWSLNNSDHLTPIITSSTTAPYIPNFNQTTEALTLYADTIILPPRGTQNYVVASTTSIDTTNGGALSTSARKVYWRSDTNGFEVKAWNDDLNYAETLTHNLIAIIRRTATATLTGANRITMACACTVDGIQSPEQPGILCPIILPATAGYLPNLDSAANTLYIPGDVIIKGAGAAAGKNASYVIAASATIDLSVAVSSAKAVYYSITGAAYVVKNHDAALTGAETADLLLVAVVRRSASSGQYLTMTCMCTVDGVSQNSGLDEKQADWARIFTPLGGAPTPTTNLPEYDTATDTLTFYQDSIFGHRSTSWVLASDTSISLAGTGSSANKVYWDTSNNTLAVKAWSTGLTRLEAAKYVQVAAVRDATAANVPPVISMMCPYTVDGKLFGYLADYATSGIENRAGDPLEGIMHRGYSTVAPENTLAAFKAAAAARRYIVEGDIQWTSDNVAVLLHDSTIDRTSDGSGAIVGMTVAAAKAFDYGSWFNAAFTGEDIPTWDEYLLLAKQLQIYGYFEIKTDATLTQVQGLINSVRKAGMKKRVQFDSFYLTALQKVVAEDAAQDVGYLVGALDASNWTAAIASAVTLKTATNRVAIEPPLANLTLARVEEAHQAGLRVVVYTINSTTDVMTLASMGVDGIMTDTLNVPQVVRDQVL